MRYQIEDGVLIKAEGNDQIVTIPEGVRVIRTSAFVGLDIKTLNLPKSLEEIEPKAFLDCKIKDEIILTKNIVSVGEKAFFGKTPVNIVVKPSYITRGWQAFWSEKRGFLADNNVTYEDEYEEPDEENIELYAEARKNGLVLDGTALVDVDDRVDGTLVIPYGVTEIKKSAFSCSSRVERVLVPGSVQIVNESAFIGCERLKEVVFCEGIDTIKIGAVTLCKKLEIIEIAGEIRNIENFAFFYNNKKTKIVVTGMEHESYDWGNMWNSHGSGIFKMKMYETIYK